MSKFILAIFIPFLVSCATVISDIEAVSPISGIPGVAALAQRTNTDVSRRLTMQEWLDFLYADPATKKGPAICVSSEDWRLNETAIADLCLRGFCTYEQEQMVKRMNGFRSEVQEMIRH